MRPVLTFEFFKLQFISGPDTPSKAGIQLCSRARFYGYRICKSFRYRAQLHSSNKLLKIIIIQLFNHHHSPMNYLFRRFSLGFLDNRFNDIRVLLRGRLEFCSVFLLAIFLDLGLFWRHFDCWSLREKGVRLLLEYKGTFLDIKLFFGLRIQLFLHLRCRRTFLLLNMLSFNDLLCLFNNFNTLNKRTITSTASFCSYSCSKTIWIWGRVSAFICSRLIFKVSAVLQRNSLSGASSSPGPSILKSSGIFSISSARFTGVFCNSLRTTYYCGSSLIRGAKSRCSSEGTFKPLKSSG